MNLYPFQAEAVNQAMGQFKCRALVALDMGLGKTPVAIEVMRRRGAWPVVVVCPASLRLNWAAEISAWIGKQSTVIRKGTDSIDGDIIILSYETAAKRALEIAMLKPQLVVLDESHYIKNRDTIRTRQLVPVCRRAPAVLLLTGTPVLNRPVELWTQLEALGVSFGNFFEYARKYCNAKKTRFGWDFNGASNIPDLNKRLKSTCMIRRLKSEVLTELPEKRRVRLNVDGVGRGAGSGLVALCNKALKISGYSLGGAMAALMEGENKDLMAAVFKAYSELATHKVGPATEIAVDMAGQAPIVVFGHHRTMIHGLKDGLDKAKIPAVVIDGSTNLDARQEAKEGFQAGKYQAIICSITAASTGLTLTRASNMLITELPWSPGIALQAEDRIHRITQKESVLIRYMVATKTLDEAMWKSLSRKAGVSHSVLDGYIKSEFEEADQISHGDFWAVIQAQLELLASEKNLSIEEVQNVA